LTVYNHVLLLFVFSYVFLHRGGKMPTPDLRVMEELNNEKELVAFIQTPFQKAHIIWTELYGLQFFLDGVSQSVRECHSCDSFHLLDEHLY
jgi:hypothetical protein